MKKLIYILVLFPVISYGQWACGDSLLDSRDGKYYQTVTIGTQCWFKENINIGTRINGTTSQTDNATIEKYCYDNLESNCDIYGGLYQWAECVHYLNSATNTTNWSPVPTGNVQGICPTGWHIPTNTEWGTLMTNQGGIAVTGGKIKTTGTTDWYMEYPTCGNLALNKEATNSSGFSAVPSGFRFSDGTFHWQHKDFAMWFISSGSNPNTDVYFGGATSAINYALNGQMYKVSGLSIRCIKD